MPARIFTRSEVYLLHEITTRLDRIAHRAILDPAGITYPEFLVLMATRESTTPTQDEVGASMDMSRSLVSQRVSALRKKGLIRQDTDRDNGRRVRLALTPAGLAAVTRIYNAMMTEADGFFEHLGPRRAGFRGALARIAERLKEAEEGSGAS